MTAVSDNFNRADSSSLGASWTEVVGDWAIVSNKVQCNDDDGGTGYYARYETDVGSSDMFAQAVTSATQTDGSSSTGLAVRMRAAANTSYQLTTRHAGDTIGNWRIVAGSETQLNFQTGANNVSTPIASGDTIRLEVVGSLLRSKVQGALVGLTVDTNITDGQRAGLNGYNNIGTDVVELDDFAGGALAADGGLVAPYVVGVSAQVTGTGTTLTPTVPPVVAAGDLVIAQATCRDAAQTMANPGSEGWAAGENPSQTGLEDRQFAKVWGLGGQTDDTTPSFSIGSGTAGWGVTLTVYRNPAHATAPWTSVASAIVAAGSQTNASSATVTAPSVTHDGTNRTVVRLYSSADDNALNAPSAGALVYGAAAYDSTDGNDFAQGSSVRENITVTTNTGTATVTETAVGNDINNGITLVLAIPSAATVNATLAASLGGTAAATATPDHPATLAASLGGTATATATPDHPATLAAALGGAASATATPDHPAVLAADLGASAAATAVVTHSATATADLGFTATATATRETAAVASAALGGMATADAVVDHPAALSASLGASAVATATVEHPAAMDAPLGFTAAAEATIDGQPVNAVLDAVLGGTATATAVVEHLATAVAALGGAAAAVATVSHSATAVADLGFVAAATATIPAGADPNPTVVRLGDSRTPTLSDPSVPRLREPR